jgi:hypothetical protein
MFIDYPVDADIAESPFLALTGAIATTPRSSRSSSVDVGYGVNSDFNITAINYFDFPVDFTVYILLFFVLINKLSLIGCSIVRLKGGIPSKQIYLIDSCI